MKRWIVGCASVLVAGAATLGVAAAWQKSSVPPPEESAVPKDLLPVGRVIAFGINGMDVEARVVEAPRGRWVRVEIDENGKPRGVWLNVDHVQWIDPSPPPKKECENCKAHGSL